MSTLESSITPMKETIIRSYLRRINNVEEMFKSITPTYYIRDKNNERVRFLTNQEVVLLNRITRYKDMIHLLIRKK